MSAWETELLIRHFHLHVGLLRNCVDGWGRDQMARELLGDSSRVLPSQHA
jgi:hypothetical protein